MEQTPKSDDIEADFSSMFAMKSISSLNFQVAVLTQKSMKSLNLDKFVFEFVKLYRIRSFS